MEAAATPLAMRLAEQVICAKSDSGTLHRRWRFIQDAAKAALPACELLEGMREGCGIEIRPQAVNEMQLRIGALPEEEVA